MASEQFEAFRGLVLRSPVLQEHLDGEDELQRFLGLVVRLGAEHGFAFTELDVQQATSENRRRWIEQRLI
jgi:hypothetical protein